MATKVQLSRRRFLRGVSLCGGTIRIGLPPLEAMFNSEGTSYAAETGARIHDSPIPTRFVLWFNGNGIPERYWIPEETGANYPLTPCLTPLAPFRNHIHVNQWAG